MLHIWHRDCSPSERTRKRASVVLPLTPSLLFHSYSNLSRSVISNRDLLWQLNCTAFVLRQHNNEWRLWVMRNILSFPSYEVPCWWMAFCETFCLFPVSNEERKQNNTCLDKENLTNSYMFMFSDKNLCTVDLLFLLVLSETADHGSSKCDKWVDSCKLFLVSGLSSTSNAPCVCVLSVHVCLFCWLPVAVVASQLRRRRRWRAKMRRTGRRSTPPWPWPTWHRGRTASRGQPAASSRSPPI